jgi:hypothetical protein
MKPNENLNLAVKDVIITNKPRMFWYEDVIWSIFYYIFSAKMNAMEIKIVLEEKTDV